MISMIAFFFIAVPAQAEELKKYCDESKVFIRGAPGWDSIATQDLLNPEERTDPEAAHSFR